MAIILASSTVKPSRSASNRSDNQIRNLFGKVGSFYPERSNFRLTPEVKEKFTNKLKNDPVSFAGRAVKHVVRTDGMKLVFNDSSRVCYRPSGIEPVVRVYSEAQSMEGLRRWRRKIRIGFLIELGMQQRPQHRPGWMYRMRHKVAIAAVLALLFLIGYGAIFGANGFLVFHRKVRDSQNLDREIQSLQQENARREQHIKALKSQPQAIEKEARERLRYARPGEVVYTLPAAQPSPEKKK